MITVTLTGAPNAVTGFSIEGHAGAEDYGRDIVCAAVSSAAYMTANTVTEILGIKAEAEDTNGILVLKLPEDNASNAKDILSGFELHIKALAGQYPQNLKIEYTEG